MHEILLTRIFSVTMWYHFAFVAVSVALFGLTVGALIVYLRPETFTPEKAPRQLALCALLFSVATVVSFLTYLTIPQLPDSVEIGRANPVLTVYAVVQLYAVIALPFVFSGICVTLALTRFPEQVGRLYAADLAGAALGCLVFFATFRVTDGPTAVAVVATLGAGAAILFSLGAADVRLRNLSIGVAAILAVATLAMGSRAASGQPLVRLLWVKGEMESPARLERWNAFSRMRVLGDPEAERAPYGWGFCTAHEIPERVQQLLLTLDADAATPITRFDGDLTAHAYLGHDITNVAHHLRQDGRVMVVGFGGGRDILSALALGQREVVGVEINDMIVDVMANEYAAFSGDLGARPDVELVHDEARSYISRVDEQYDVIQVSLIDTWAATAAGAYTLTENSVYTVEAWETFLSRLSDDGLLTFSRWYHDEHPGEVFRLITLAVDSLRKVGVDNTREHIVVVRGGRSAITVGTILVSRRPFSAEDLATLDAVASDHDFQIMVSPEKALHPALFALADAARTEEARTGLPMDVSAPTDDRPFFFQMLRFRDLFSRAPVRHKGARAINQEAVSVLGKLVVAMLGLTALCILVPLLLTLRRGQLSGTASLFVYFGGIGLGFMLVEMSQMQRLSVFLGHPTWGLTVVLFTLLLSGGAGSWLTRNLPTGLSRDAMIRLGALLGVVLLVGAATPSLLAALRGAPTFARVLVAGALTAPVGVVMGMGFPIGMGLVTHRKLEGLAAWMWGINGATSVLASVLAIAVAMSAGISSSYWMGLTAYAVGIGAVFFTERSG